MNLNFFLYGFSVKKNTIWLYNLRNLSPDFFYIYSLKAKGLIVREIIRARLCQLSWAQLLFLLKAIVGVRLISLDDSGEWSCWTDWSECSVSCGVGYKQRSRQCMVPNNKGLEGSGCEGSALSQEPCEMPSCQCKLAPLTC